MISPIQFVIISCVVLLILYVLGNRNKTNVRAGKKFLLLFFFCFVVSATLFPELVNNIAHALGVGRGTDLVVYVLAVAFIVFAINTYLKFQEYKITLHTLSRKIALLEKDKKDNE